MDSTGKIVFENFLALQLLKTRTNFDVKYLANETKNRNPSVNSSLLGECIHEGKKFKSFIIIIIITRQNFLRNDPI